MVPDETKICDKCAFEFDEYQRYHHLYETEEDPLVPEDQKSNLVDNPILTFVFGIISFILMALFLFDPNITLLYLIGVIVFVFITYYLSIRPAKVKFAPFQVVGKWLANIAISITIFKIVYMLMGSLF
jgi:membrane-bound ClpP family serine protease